MCWLHEVNRTWLITSDLTNQRSQKAFTCVVHCILTTDIYLVQTCTSQACRLYLHNTDHCWNILTHRCIVDTEVWICCRTFCHHSLRFSCNQPRIRQQNIFLSTCILYMSSLHSPNCFWFALNIQWVYGCFVPMTIHTQVHFLPSLSCLALSLLNYFPLFRPKRHTKFNISS